MATKAVLGLIQTLIVRNHAVLRLSRRFCAWNAPFIQKIGEGSCSNSGGVFHIKCAELRTPSRHRALVVGIVSFCAIYTVVHRSPLLPLRRFGIRFEFLKNCSMS